MDHQKFCYFISKRCLIFRRHNVYLLTLEIVKQDKCPKYSGSSILLCPTPCVQLFTVSMHCTLVQLSLINFQFYSINSCTADCATGASFTDHN